MNGKRHEICCFALWTVSVAMGRGRLQFEARDRMVHKRRRDSVGWPLVARAQFNASRPITMIVPWLLTRYMSGNLGHTFGAESIRRRRRARFRQVARSAPDGHALGWTSTGFAVMAAMSPTLVHLMR
jgi:hypothetical protein